VTVAENGHAALHACAAQNFDFILMDIQMPGMDGLQATAAIRKKEIATGARIPIIAMTAHALKGDRERCLAAGMDGYVSKPIRPIELFTAIESVMQGRSAPAPGAPPADQITTLHERIPHESLKTKI
jgi:CheY-like chemotaxis protein